MGMRQQLEFKLVYRKKRKFTRQKIAVFFEKRYGIKGKSIAKRYRRLVKYRRLKQYKDGVFYCKSGKPITFERINRYENMCHYLVRKFFPALALYEASFNYEDLVSRSQTEVFLALLNGFDPVKAFTCKDPDPEKRKQKILKKKANPEKTLESSEKSIVYGRIWRFLRRTRYNYHPDQVGGRTIRLNLDSSEEFAFEYKKGLYTEMQDVIPDTVLKNKIKLLSTLEARGGDAARHCFYELNTEQKEAIIESLQQFVKNKFAEQALGNKKGYNNTVEFVS